jgi:hypothetical protein
MYLFLPVLFLISQSLVPLAATSGHVVEMRPFSYGIAIKLKFEYHRRWMAIIITSPSTARSIVEEAKKYTPKTREREFMLYVERRVIPNWRKRR